MGTDPTIESQSLILFDGICNLCNASVNFIIDRDPKQTFQFASLQSSVGKGILKENGIKEEEMDSILLIEQGRIFEKSEAALRIARKLSGIWPILGIFRILPLFVRDSVYDFIARNRYKWFGKTDSCRIPTKELQYRFLDS